MTPRDKAKEIVSRFKESCKNDIFSDWDYVYKRNALIAVDEAIDVLQKLYNYIADEKDLFKIKWEIIWWQDVRKEIEKL